MGCSNDHKWIKTVTAAITSKKRYALLSIDLISKE